MLLYSIKWNGVVEKDELLFKSRLQTKRGKKRK